MTTQILQKALTGMRSTRRSGLLALAVFALLGWLSPDVVQAKNNKKPPVGGNGALVAVFAAGEDRQTFALESGQAFQLPVGVGVRLELIAPAWDNPKQQRREHVAGHFATSDPAVIKLTAGDPATGMIWAKALTQPRNGRLVKITYDPQGSRLSGEIFVEVVPAAVAAAPAPPPADQAGEIVAALYRGILMREPDPAGAQGWIDKVRRDGFYGALSAAHDIAASPESRVELYKRPGLTNEQRLLAMYRTLLGIDANGWQGGLWQSQLERLQAGDVSGVVDDLVRSPEFFQQQGFGVRR